jgi:hypothetical protein
LVDEQETSVIIEQQHLAQTILPPSTIVLTANEICDYYNLQNPKSPINTENLR